MPHHCISSGCSHSIDELKKEILLNMGYNQRFGSNQFSAIAGKLHYNVIKNWQPVFYLQICLALNSTFI